MPDKDVTLKIGAEFDDSGVQQAQAAQQQVAQAAEQAAQQQQAAEQATAEAMRFTAMGKQELVRELEHLTQARQQAAAAGDAAQYEQLTKSINNAKQALEGLNTGQSMATIATVQQAQAGMQMAQSFGALAASAKDGSANIAGMAQQVMALGMAIKAGLGPIGWVMAAVQGLQMAWDAYQDSQAKAAKEEHEREMAILEDLERHRDALNELARLERGNALDGMREELRAVEQDLDKVEKARRAAARESARQAAEDEQRRMAAAEHAYRMEMANTETLKVQGRLTEEQAERRKRDAEDARNATLRQVEEERRARENAAQLDDARAAAAMADRLEQEINARYDSFADVLSVKMPSMAEWQALQLRLQEGQADLRDMETARDLHERANQVRDALQDLGIAWSGTDTELLQYLEDLRSAREAAQERVAALREQADNSRAAAAESASQARLAKEGTAQQEQLLEAQRAQADAATAAADAQKAKADAEKAAADHARAVQKELSGMADTYKVTGNYAVQDTRTQAEILDADRRALWQREMRLRQLLAEAQDADTRQAISAALEETAAQQRGLAQATAQAAQEARKALAKAEPPDFSSNNRMVQRNLDRLAKVYANLAKRAERQAASGNDAALERTQRLMARYAERMGRMARDNEKAVELTRQTNSRLDLLRGRKPAMDQPAAPAATQENPQIAPGTSSMANPVQQPAQMAAMQEQAAAQAAGIADLAAAVQALATAAEQTAKTAAAASAAAKASLKSLAAAHKKLSAEVADIRLILETLT